MFKDRVHAGTLLARRLSSYRGSECVVLGLPRGGIVVAAVVASSLELPLDVFVVKKIGAPHNGELAIGAVAPDGVSYIDWQLAQRVRADEHYVKSQITNLNVQIKGKTRLYRKGRRPLFIKGKTAIVVDDGAATGATVRAAIAWLEKKKAGRIVVALPVAPPEFIEKIQRDVHEMVALNTPLEFSAVGQFYDEFPQVTDEEVVELLKKL
jgi:predicted phosphoribosyltransferase